MVKNYMENFVEDLLPTVLNTYKDMCNCDRCIDDIKALTLNRLEPLYVVTERGEAYAKSNEIDRQFKINLVQKIVEAIEIVRKNPRHD